jgi:transposase
VRWTKVWARLLGIAGAIVEGVEFEGDDLVVRVHLDRRRRLRCGICGKRARSFDQGGGERRWRALDLGSTRCFVVAPAPRVRCQEHGVVVAWVPWADHKARSTRAFDDQVAWLAVYCNRSTVAELMRTSWRTVGWIVARVSRRLGQGRDQLAGLRRIGIDEISWRRGQRYLIVVLDHDTGRLVWAAEGRDEDTLDRFFFELGAERAKLITHVSADAGSWIANVVAIRCPNAVRCMDPFHVTKWATDALDQVRREVWNAARRTGDKQMARDLKGARWALWKGGERISARQQAKLAWIERTNRPLYQAYLLKEHLRLVFQLPFDAALDLLEVWLEWAASSLLQPFVELVHSIDEHLEAILNALDHGLSNARVEALNTRIRLITRRAYGFHSATPLIGLAMLSFGGLNPALPGRAA